MELVSLAGCTFRCMNCGWRHEISPREPEAFLASLKRFADHLCPNCLAHTPITALDLQAQADAVAIAVRMRQSMTFTTRGPIRHSGGSRNPESGGIA